MNPCMHASTTNQGDKSFGVYDGLRILLSLDDELMHVGA
jgi:hypothetical protein